MVTQNTRDAFLSVLHHAGASLARDPVDARIIADVVNGTGAIIDHEEDVGAWPEYHSSPARTDTDLDGMPDRWETRRGLDPGDPDDRNRDDNVDGYTNLEEYLHWLTLPIYYGSYVRTRR